MVNRKTVKIPFWQKGKIDIGFLSLVMILLVIGLIMMFSASYAYSYAYFGSSYKFIFKQGICAILGLGFMYLLSHINYHYFQKYSWAIYFVTLLMLVAVFFCPSVAGVHRWIPLPIIGQFQPSELGKFAIITIFAALIGTHYKDMDKIKFVGFLLLVLGVVCLLVVTETHVSATILIFLIGIMLIFVGGLSKKLTITFSVLFVICAVIGVFALKYVIHYAGDRLAIWRDPWSDPTGDGYQTIQSLLAIGSGNLLGRGLGQSRQKHLWVPEPHNDFIFSIVCEELGLVGALVIIVLFCLLVWRGFSIAMHSQDKFGSLMAAGLSFQVGLQAALNMLVVTNTVPNTGISLPFFSYGGTALIILLAEMGIVLSISRSANSKKL